MTYSFSATTLAECRRSTSVSWAGTASKAIRSFTNGSKLDRVARVLLIDKAAEIIERYRTESYMNYVFPVFKWKKMDQAHMYATVSRVGGKVNSTLQKICDHLGIREKVYWARPAATSSPK